MDQHNGDHSDEFDTEVSNENSSGDSSFPFYGTSEQVVAQYSHCGFCGSNLHFTHVTDFVRNLTQESASCPECGTKVRRATHRLQ